MDNFIDAVVPLLINGHYSDWFFKIIIGQFFSFVQHNFAFLWIFAITCTKLARLTKAAWDDKLANRFVDFLSKFNKPFTKEK